LRNSKEILNLSKKIAVVRTDRLGDMILTLPLANALKKRFPSAQVTMIARTYTKPLLYNSTALDNYFFVDEFENGIKDIFKNNKFDTVFFPHPRFDEAFAAFKAGIKLRIGSAYRFYSFLYNCKIREHRKESLKHEAEYNVNMLSLLMNENFETVLPSIYIKPKALDSIIKKLKELSVGSEFIIIHPGSGGSAYDWNVNNFAVLAELIYKKLNLNVLVTGIESEFEKCRTLCEISKHSINCCGLFDLEEMIALISKSKMLIANSTGVLHIAAALNTNVLGLFPNSAHLSQKRWGPYSKNSFVVNPPQSNNLKLNDDMSLITVEKVFEKVEILLHKSTIGL
jgi:ADP-heptose:LPS heptosyltransferase